MKCPSGKGTLLALLLALSAPSFSLAQTQPSSVPPASPREAAESAPAQKITDYTLPPDLARKAHNRGRIQFALRLFETFYTFFVLWLILRLGWSANLRLLAEAITRRRFLQGLLFSAFFFTVFALFDLPIGIFQQWVLRIYRISIQPWSSWFRDWLVALALTAVIGGLVVALLYAIIRRSPRRAWLYAWLVSLPLTAAGIFITPYVIDPLFNKFEPLSRKAPELIEPLQQVTRRAGMEIPRERMFWMRASDKYTYSNAYVTGFGASKRIVIWDTAIALESRDGLLVTFGHELGHYALNHVRKGFFLSAAIFFVLAFVVHLAVGPLLGRRAAAWHIRGLDDLASFPAIVFLLALFGFPLAVLGTNFSRHIEHQADVYAVEVTHGILADPGQAGAISFQMFGEQATIDPHPNPVNVFLFFDHPPVGDRIRFFASYNPWQHGQSPEFVK